MNNRENIGKNLDWVTILLYFILVISGWLTIYSANYDRDIDQGIFDISHKAGKQFLWIILSIFTIIGIFLLDIKVYFSIPFILYGFIMLTLFLVLFMPEINGAKSWFNFFGLFKFQPSEFGKFICALVIAKFLSINQIKYTISLSDLFDSLAAFLRLSPKRVRLKFDNRILFVFLLIFSFPALILLQPDLGSALVYFSFIIVLYIDGLPGYIPLMGFSLGVLFILTLVAPLYYLITAIIIIGVIVFIFIRKTPGNLLGVLMLTTLYVGIAFGSKYVLDNGIGIKRYQLSRVLAVLGEEDRMKDEIAQKEEYFFNTKMSTEENRAYKQELRELKNTLRNFQRDEIYNLKQSKIAIGSGGAMGKGYMNGYVTKGKYIPEQDTDFIFCTIGEEQGFVGSLLFIIAYIIFLLRLVIIAERQKNKFSRIYGYGVIMVFLFHFFVNVAMTIGIFPVVGIPLPFFSYGGSSLWSFTILLFIFMKLDYHRNQLLARS